MVLTISGARPCGFFYAVLRPKHCLFCFSTLSVTFFREYFTFCNDIEDVFIDMIMNIHAAFINDIFFRVVHVL
jgi:hypothetical protein